MGVTLATAACLWLFLFLPAQGASRRQNLAFDGVIERKVIAPSQSRYNPRSSYILMIRDETGRLIPLRVTPAMYERAVVGMPARKKAGEQWPTLGTKASSN